MDELISEDDEPHYEYERLWRRIRKNIQELEKYIKYEIINNSENITQSTQEKVDKFLYLTSEHKW